MAPSRRRGPSGKTSATVARSAAIQAAENRRQEEKEHRAACISNSKNIRSDSDNKISTAKGDNVGHDTRTHPESTNNKSNNNSTAVAAHTEAGKKRKKFPLLPPVAAEVGTAATMSSASSSSSPAQGVVVTTTRQVPFAQSYCKIVPEDQHRIFNQRSRHGKIVYKRKQDCNYSEGEDDVGDVDDGDEEDEGCLDCHEKVKNMARIRVIDDDDDNDSDELYVGDSNIQVRCDDCRGYICNGCHWCHEFQANHEIRVCDRCDAFYCRGCDEMDQCDDCGEVVCGSCSTLLSCKFCGGGLCEECATACGRCGIVLCSRDAKFAVDCDTCRLSYCLVCLASGSKEPCVRCGHRPSKRMEQLVHLRLKSIYKAFKSSSSNNNIAGSSIGGVGGNHKNNNNTISSHISCRGDSNNDHSSNYNNMKDSHGGRSRRNKPTTLQDMVGDHDDEDISGTDPAMSIMMGAAAGVLPHKFCHDLEQNYLTEQKKADAAAEALLAEIDEEESAIAQKKSKKKKKKERKNASKQHQPDAKGNDIGGIEKNIADVEKNKNPQNDIKLLHSRDDEVNANILFETDSTDEATKGNEEVENKPQKAEETKTDLVEKELVECVSNTDLEGIENVLFCLKGVPGRAALRKNAKKALKRLKLELNPSTPTSPMARVEASVKIEKKPKTARNRASSTMENVLPVVLDARSSSKKTTKKSTSSHEKPSYNSTKDSHSKPSFQKHNESNRCEDVVEIVSRLVGWMIGKNGQRIRDLMEESGAKIWIDQEKFKGQETRNVYMSGDRRSVDQAVLLVNDVIANAPPPQGTTNAITAATVSMVNMTKSQQPLQNLGISIGLQKFSTTPSAQSVIHGIIGVKSAWSEAPGGRLPGDRIIRGTIPKPPALISSSVAMQAKKVNDFPQSRPDSGNHIIGSAKNREAPGIQIDVSKIAADTTTPVVDAPIIPALQQKSAEVTTEIVTCDFRFVPLLIGKRGWTIKNIQDDSGARVDIDQTVTPRQVRISGSKVNVDKAVTMVRDVLSYPHAQLQSSSEGALNDGNVVVPELGPDTQLSKVPFQASTPTKQKLLAASAVLEHDMIRNNMPLQGDVNDRNHSPPPVVGDAKSVISASSSLSSTPEPSMASSSKGFIASHLQNDSLLPPPAEHYTIGSIPSQPVSRQFFQSVGGPADEVNVRGLWASTGVGSGPRITVPPHSSYAEKSGQIDFQGGVPTIVRHGAPSHPQSHQIQQQDQHLQLNSAIIHQQKHPHQHRIQQSFVPAGQLSHRMPLEANPNGSPVDRKSQFNAQNGGKNQQSHSMHSSLGGSPPYNLYSNEGVSAARAIATTPLRDLMHHAGVGCRSGVSSPSRGSRFIDGGSRLWNSGNPTYSSSGLLPHTSELQPRVSSGFSAPPIGFSVGHHQQSKTSGMTTSLGYTNSQVVPSQRFLPNMNALSVATNTTATFAGSISSGLRHDDSRMVDSLFGGDGHIQSSSIATPTNSLLAGFDVLNLSTEGDGTKPSGLWGPSDLTEVWRDNKGNAMSDRGSAVPNVASIGTIFSNDIPDLSQPRMKESCFKWDSRNSSS